MPRCSAADRAFPIWSAMAPKERSLRLLKVADRIEQCGDELAEIEMRNCGKPLATAKAVDVGNTVDVFRFFAGALRTMTRGSRPMNIAAASPRCCGATRSAWWPASRRGIIR